MSCGVISFKEILKLVNNNTLNVEYKANIRNKYVYLLLFKNNLR